MTGERISIWLRTSQPWLRAWPIGLRALQPWLGVGQRWLRGLPIRLRGLQRWLRELTMVLRVSQRWLRLSQLNWRKSALYNARFPGALIFIEPPHAREI